MRFSTGEVAFNGGLAGVASDGRREPEPWLGVGGPCAGSPQTGPRGRGWPSRPYSRALMLFCEQGCALRGYPRDSTRNVHQLSGRGVSSAGGSPPPPGCRA